MKREKRTPQLFGRGAGGEGVSCFRANTQLLAPLAVGKRGRYTGVITPFAGWRDANRAEHPLVGAVRNSVSTGAVPKSCPAGGTYWLSLTQKSGQALSCNQMASKTLFPVDSPVAQRQPKTDRLILPRFLKDAADDMRLDRERDESRPRGSREMGRFGDFGPARGTQRNADAGRFSRSGVWRRARLRRLHRRNGGLAPRAALSDCR